MGFDPTGTFNDSAGALLGRDPNHVKNNGCVDMSKSTMNLMRQLADVMRRSDPVWCELNGKRQIDDEEWDSALAEVEDWLEDNTP